MEKKANNKKCWIMTAVVLAAVLVLLVGALIGFRIFGKAGKENTGAPTNPTTNLAAKPAEVIEEMTISTEVCDLAFPAKWKDRLRTQYTESDDGGAMTFFAGIGEKEAKLFAVVFSHGLDSAAASIGVVNKNDAPVLVSILYYEPDPTGNWTEEELEILYAMAEDSNYLIDKLVTRPDFDGNYESYFAPEDTKITTPFCTFSYPGTWADRIWTAFTPADNGGILAVYGQVAMEDALLFRICFGAEMDEAIPVGSLKVGGGQLPVSFVMAEAEDTGDWSAADRDDYAAMQEAINDLLTELSENPNFTALS